MGQITIKIEERPMLKGFEEVCKLVDEFATKESLPVHTGPKPKLEDFFYMKLAFFGILNRCPEKSHYLERARLKYPQIFKKTLLESRS